jgi:hypothetical protein
LDTEARRIVQAATPASRWRPDGRRGSFRPTIIRTGTMRLTITFFAVGAAMIALGCSTDSDKAARDEAPAGGVTLSRSAMPASDDSLAAGDVRIVTTDGSIDLALVGDSISSGLSPAAVEKVRRETDTAAVTGTGFGAEMEKMVKGTVQGAIGTRASIPLSAVRAVRYDGEKLVFEWNGAPPKMFVNAKVNGKPLLASFAPDEARRFADAVNARKGRPKNI